MEKRIIPIEEIGVVVQGPIQSRGRTMKDLSSKTFDTSTNINNLFLRIENMGAHPILVTWDGEDSSGLTETVKNKTIKTRLPQRSIVFRIRNNFYGNNKYRQFYSTLEGVNYFISQGQKYVIKIRTDQDFPIETLLKYLSELNTVDIIERIFTPLLNVDKPNMFYDFYYFSDSATMLRFHQIMLNTKEICSNVHFDVFYRWTFRDVRCLGTHLHKIYTKYPIFTKRQLGVIYSAWEKDFRVLPKECWQGLTWRGEPFDETSTKPAFAFASDHFPARIEDILERRTTKLPRIDVIAMISFLLSSRLEDLVRKILGFARRIENRIKISLKFRKGRHSS